MNIVRIRASLVGYYSGAAFDQSICVSQEFFDKIDTENIHLIVHELDGKYSEEYADIDITTYYEKDIPNEDFTFLDRNNWHFIEYFDEFVENQNPNFNLDNEIDKVRDYLHNIDTKISVKVSLKKSQLPAFYKFMSSLD